MTKLQLMQAIEAHKMRSAWNRGVKKYAFYLVDEVYLDDTDIVSSSEDVYLNGALNWKQYSDGGLALICDTHIAETLCTPSELKKTDHGRKHPNGRETWLDVQVRALYQAYLLIVRCICGGSK